LDKTEEDWKPKPGDRVVRHPRQDDMSPVHLELPTKRSQSRALASPLTLLYSFVGLISLGTILLSMPFSHHGTGFAPFVEALFTATSAATVTGLVIQETATYWTKAGQMVILALMFVGGLGFMTIATFLLVLVGQRVTLSQRLLVRESLGVNHLGGLVRLTIRIVLVATTIQIIGFVALLARFLFLDYSVSDSIWHAIFHAVSGFNNAGFVALPETNSLSSFQDDRFILGIIGGLILLGALSYWVMVDVASRFNHFSLYSLNSKLVLILTGILIVSGALVFFFSEFDNERTLGPLPLLDKVIISVFESISGRTAGFATVSFGDTEQHTNFFFTSLMFVGGASASVAGGIKVNTVAVILVAVLSTLRGSPRATAFGREIPQDQVRRAMTMGAVATTLVFLVALTLTFAEREFPFIDLLFESVSAFGTVGLSTGLTPDLSRWGHLIIIFSMFIGRIGPLTLGLAMVQRSQGDLYRYAQERVTIG
jgi:trk system potassium uptake protein TrkH